MEMKNVIVRGTTKCDCGYEFSLQDLTKLEKITDHGFYGGIVKHCSEAICPNCNKKVILLLKQVGQTWEVINTVVKEEDKTDSIENNNVEVEETETKNIKNDNVNINDDKTEAEIDKNNEKEEENNTSNDFICPVCERACKSQIGLNSHMKTHENN